MHVMPCYLIINWVVFEFIIFDPIIICFVFELANYTMKYLYILTQPKHEIRTQIATHRASWLGHHPMYLKGKIKDITSEYILIITIKCNY